MTVGAAQVQAIFRCHAHGHEAPFDCNRMEAQQGLMKGFWDDRLSFEMQASASGDVMYRGFNEDNSTNCELKTHGGRVEWLRVFNGHNVCLEKGAFVVEELVA